MFLACQRRLEMETLHTPTENEVAEKTQTNQIKKILLIDEDKDCALSTALAEEGYDVVHCDSVHEAWNLVYPHRPHLIILRLYNANGSALSDFGECRALSMTSEELFAGFDEYLVKQFVRRTAVRKSRVVAFKIVRALDAAVFPRHILLRNIDPERVRAVALLKLDLAFTGEEPVHEELGGIGMRRFIEEADGAATCAQRAAFLQLESFAERKPLLDRFFAFPGIAGDADGELAGGQPVDRLAIVAGDGHVHLAIEPAHELGAELGMVVKKEHRSVHTVHARIGGDDFSFPLGIEQVPICRELLRAHEVGVVA